jgi:hypothetical protein
LHGAQPPRRTHPRSVGKQPIAPVNPDLKRLETALHWLQREADAARLPPAPLLEPERMAPPLAKAPSHALRWLLAVLFATAGAASLAYSFSGERPVPASTRVASSQPETLQQSFHALRPIGQKETAPVGPQDRDAGSSIAPSIAPPPRSDVAPPAPVPVVETVALAPPRSGGAEVPRPDTPVRALDREAIALLVRQGEQLISAGDIAAARTVFQRAAEAGDLAASVALAASYDPAALKQLGVLGIHADLKKARSLYEKAESMGSAEATRRLQMLARQ